MVSFVSHAKSIHKKINNSNAAHSIVCNAKRTYLIPLCIYYFYSHDARPCELYLAIEMCDMKRLIRDIRKKMKIINKKQETRSLDPIHIIWRRCFHVCFQFARQEYHRERKSHNNLSNKKPLRKFVVKFQIMKLMNSAQNHLKFV